MAKTLSMDLRSRAVAGRPRQRAYRRQSRMGTKTSLTTTDTLTPAVSDLLDAKSSSPDRRFIGQRLS
jgi:hypothetical protein